MLHDSIFVFRITNCSATTIQCLLLLLKVLIIVKLNTKLQGHFTHIINIKKVLHGSRSQLRYHRERQSYDMRNGADCGEAKQGLAAQLLFFFRSKLQGHRIELWNKQLYH